MPENENKDTQVKQIRTKAGDHRTTYIDSTRMAHSPFDIRMHFALLKEVEPGLVAEEEQTVIIMSPQHAKAFLKVLTDNLKRWEDKYGIIPVSKEAEAEQESEES